LAAEVRNSIFAGGRFVPAHASAVHAVINPATEEPIGTVPVGDQEDVSRAVGAARAALRDPGWSRTTGAERAWMLRRLADLLEAHRDDLAPLLTRENGLAIGSSRVSVVKTAASYRYYADLAESIQTEEVRASAGAHTLVRREPVGVAALIVPWNGPQSILSWKLGPALAAGCTAVIKPALETTLDGYLLMELVAEAGFPDGVVNLVPGGAQTGAMLVADEGVDKVAFTGSTAAGRQIALTCAQRLIPATLELGGKSAAIVLDDASLADFAPMVVGVCSPNTGQVCRACTRVLVPEFRYDEAVEVIAGAMAAVRVGDPMQPDTVFGPVVSQRQRDRIEEYIAIGLAAGAKLVTGGGRPAGLDRGYYVEPTVFRDVTNDMRIAREEIFGPVVVVLPYRDDDDAVSIANDSDFGLGGFIYTADVERGTDIARRIETGSIGVNHAAMTMEGPFGGYKQSGLGKELGPEGLAAYQNVKSIYRPGNAP
jgi:aldehyde dehydrogenase (NAD+)